MSKQKYCTECGQPLNTKRIIKTLSIILAVVMLILAVALGALLTTPKEPRFITVTVTEAVTVVKTTVAPPTTTPLARKWISSDEGVISYLDAGKYVGQKKTVEGIIVRTHKSSKAIFLDFHDPWQGYFYAVIFKDDWGNFAFDPAEYYKGKEVRVTGVIKMYQGSPEIIVESPSQIEVAYKGFNYP